MIATTGYQFGCVTAGKLRDICFPSYPDCLLRTKACKRVKAVSCVDVTAVTEGETTQVCLPTYGECVRKRAWFASSGEYALGDCDVRRYEER